jgi:hypothetical protein
MHSFYWRNKFKFTEGLRVAIPAKAGRKPNPEDGFFDITIFEPAFGIAIQQIFKKGRQFIFKFQDTV